MNVRTRSDPGSIVLAFAVGAMAMFLFFLVTLPKSTTKGRRPSGADDHDDAAGENDPRGGGGGRHRQRRLRHHRAGGGEADPPAARLAVFAAGGSHAVMAILDHDFQGDEDGHNCTVCVERDDSLHMCWREAHRCPICEERASQHEDDLCVECRAWVTDSSVVVLDPVLLILSQHQHMCGMSNLDSTMCFCGEQFDGGPGNYRWHVAQKIYEALGIDGPIPHMPARLYEVMGGGR